MSSFLFSRTVARESISTDRRKEMLALMHACYEGVDAARFLADLDAKQFVILLFSRRTKELVGFSTIRIAEETLEGRKVEIVFSGDTVIHPDHWGGKTLQAAFGRFAIARKLSRPGTPVLWLLLSAGYKTYLLMTNYFPMSLPNRNGTAESRRAFLDDIASRWFGAQYADGIVRFTGTYRVKEGVSPVDRATAKNADVAFYLEKNPGHVNGDELVCLAELRLRDLARAFLRIGWLQARNALGLRPREAEAKA